MSVVTMKDMLEAGVHFGHQVSRWNPKMKPYVFGARGGIYIIDLQKTVQMAEKAAEFAKKVAANGGRMIFVGTKKQARETIIETANACGQFYITERWLGGTLTNFETLKQNIARMKKLGLMKEKDEYALFSKKEVLKFEKERLKLEQNFSGIRDMKELPAALFVVDLKKEHIAVEEARKLKIPVIGLADTNSDPEVCDFPIPSNDDATRAIKLFSSMVAESFNAGLEVWEQKIRAMTDKQADVARELQQRQKTAAAPAPVAEKTDGGPAVVKRPKKRALVTAAAVDDAEIEELATAAQPATETVEE